ncbi:MAG TPA: ABC transporter permease [Vicinamibacterales bacterium]|jgi:predicted permease
MWKDIRHAARMLLQAKGWTAVVVLSLALGIGANTAMFSAFHNLILTELPVRDPGTLVRLRLAGPNDMATNTSDYGTSRRTPDGLNVWTTFSFPMYQQFLADNQTMSEMFACAPFGRVNVIVDGQPEIASAFISTGNYYRMLGVRARMGRTILPDDDTPSSPAVAVISAKYWSARFGSDPSVVGKIVRVNAIPVTIVGVLDPSFTGVQLASSEPPDISFPLALDSQIAPQFAPPGGGTPPIRVSQATTWWLQVMGRLKPGVTAAQVQGNLEGVFQATAKAGLASYLAGLSDAERSTAVNRRRENVPHLRVDSGSRGIFDVNPHDIRSVSILSAVVGLVLLIVCANVANLLLSRATSRQKELSVRLSLGATRWRLIRQLLTESLLLASAGGLLGIAVGYWGKQLLPGAAGRAVPLDWRLLGFVLALTWLTGIVFGIAPALRATRMNVNDALKSTSRSVVGSRSLLGRGLLVVQVAISLMVIIGAGLFLRTLQNLRHVDVGFDARNLVTFRVNPQLLRYDQKRTNALYRDLLERLASVPGVRTVSFSQPALLSGSVNSTSIFVQGRTYSLQERDNGINRLVVSPNFFEAMGIPLRAGRGITERDSESAPRVVLINDAAVRKYFPNEDPLGRRFGSSVETSGQLEIVGVVRDAKYDSVRDAAPPTMYVPYLQTRMTNPVIAVRTSAQQVSVMKEVRSIVSQLDANLPLMDISTQITMVEQRFQQERVFALAYSLFGGLALLIAAIGLFGLMSYNVSRRTNEIGIRMALGAQRGDVLRQVLRESLILVVIGVAIGVGVAFWAGRFVATMLFGLEPNDILTMIAATIMMIAVSAIAGYLPARRASRVDPMIALRYD